MAARVETISKLRIPNKPQTNHYPSTAMAEAESFDDDSIILPECVRHYAKELQTIMASADHGKAFREGFAALVQINLNAMKNKKVQTKNLN